MGCIFRGNSPFWLIMTDAPPELTEQKKWKNNGPGKISDDIFVLFYDDHKRQDTLVTSSVVSQ